MKEKEDNQQEEKGNKMSEIDEIRGELNLLKEKLLPEKLAKAVDASYTRIRIFLQILAIMITIFLTGAISFGFFGVKNIFSIHQEAAEVHNLATKVSEDQKEVEKSLNSAKQMESQIKQTINDFNDTFQRTISDMRNQSQKEVFVLKNEIKGIRENLDNVSDIFNRVAVKQADTLNAREAQLLVLLAQEITPNSPIFRFNYGSSAMRLGRYDEAIEQFEAVLKSKDASSNLIARTQTLIAKCEKLKASPPRVQELKGVALGGYYILQLHANTLDALHKNGYFTYEQTQKIIDDAKVKK